mgnify:FL=1
MDKLKIKEAIIVEGRYDKNALSQVVDAVIIETSGFGVFSDREKLELIRSIAIKRGIIVLTDSDSAGFVIRNHIKGAVDKGLIRQAYIPEIPGRERRKRAASREGLLGVEGMSPEVLRKALVRAGATPETKEDCGTEERIKKADLYAWGLSGAALSAQKRRELLKKLELPQKLSADAFIDVLNALYTRVEAERLINEVLRDKTSDI